MSRLIRMLWILGIAAAASGVGRAQDAQTAQELKNLEQAVQEQSKRIDSLTQQVAKLRLFLEAKNEAGAAATPEEPPKPAPEAAPEAPKAEAVPKVETKPEDATGGTKHVVAKGETLTSIAKHYNIPLAELQKANKNVNDRKLQIGQTLTIPTAKTPESAPEKKE